MGRYTTFGSLLLISSALVAPAALAQTPAGSGGAGQTPSTGATPGSTAEGAPPEQEVEISGPGASAGEASEEIVVTGSRIPNVIRATPEVVSVLSAADIARTGEGDIAGALQRVTGLSVVGSGFVYVRGLGERYSLALLNGSPLPSPEPLRRVVPLDIFPTSVIASSVVQKSYSVAYPGEFGGGVINLTTRSVPREPFLTISGGIGVDTETTNRLGYTYYGSDTDWTGFDDGTRDVPPLLQQAFDSGKQLFVGPNYTLEQVQNITAQLQNANTNLIQRNDDIPPNWGIDVTGGKTFQLGGVELGVIAALGYGNDWQTRGGLQQRSGGVQIGANGQDVLNPSVNYRFLSTENRVVVNGLLGLNLDFGEHLLRWTNLYIRDTIKETRIQAGTDAINVDSTIPVQIGRTAWFERQLIDTQAVLELDFDPLSIDLRATYANSQREAPYEREIGYRYNDSVDDFTNDLSGPGQFARVAFSDLEDNVYGLSGDLAYQLSTALPITLSAGLNYYKNDRYSERRTFRYVALSDLGTVVPQTRPDYLLSDFNVYNYDVVLQETSGSEGAAAYQADLEVYAGYGQIEAEVIPDLTIQTGVRYEDGTQSVTPLNLFGTGSVPLGNRIKKSYWLPAATITWGFAPDMQLRLHASKTIARPQFRELSPQQYTDIESDRTFFGNQFLTDSELINAEARYEYYFGRDQRFSVAGFYKEIDKPIEAVAFRQGGTFFTTFANAPKATLYGGEIEVQKYFPLENLGGFFTPRRLVLIGNYTYTQSDIQVQPGDTTIPFGSNGVPAPASDFFQDGERLTGQSDHLANLQIGLENTDRLSQQTLLLSYASKRVTNRGPAGQPDFIEEPGLRLDFVMREGVQIMGREVELKFEARNLTGENYEEFQTLGNSRVDINTFDVGRQFTVGLGVTF